MSGSTQSIRALHRARHLMRQDRDGRARRDRDAVALDQALADVFLGPVPPDDEATTAEGTAPLADASAADVEVDTDGPDYPAQLAASLRRLGLVSADELEGATVRPVTPDASAVVDAMLAPLARKGARDVAAAARKRLIAQNDKAEAAAAVAAARRQLYNAEQSARYAATRLEEAQSHERWASDFPKRLARDRTELLPHVAKALTGEHPKWRVVDGRIVGPTGRPLLPLSQRGPMGT